MCVGYQQVSQVVSFVHADGYVHLVLLQSGHAPPDVHVILKPFTGLTQCRSTSPATNVAVNPGPPVYEL